MAIKVIQWATGTVGSLQLQQIIQRPDLELVGVFCFSESKAGVDAGDLCGLPRTGIEATASKEEIYAMEADVVLHAASKAHGAHTNEEDIISLLASGKNVITTTSYNHLPSYGEGLKQQFEEACKHGNSSFYAAGENPGFMLERLTATVTGICRQINSITFDEFVMCADHPVREMVVDLMGFAKKPEEVTVDNPMFKVLTRAYEQALNGLADELGIQYDKIVPTIEVDTLGHDIEIACGPVPAGTISGQCLTWTGYWNDKPFATIREIWLLTKDTSRWGVSELANYKSKDYYRLNILGLPEVVMEMGIDIPADAPAEMQDVKAATYIMISNTGIAAIPEVLNADVGVLIPRIFGVYRPDCSDENVLRHRGKRLPEVRSNT